MADPGDQQLALRPIKIPQCRLGHRLAVVVRLAPVGVEQVDLEVCESSIAVTAAR